MIVSETNASVKMIQWYVIILITFLKILFCGMICWYLENKIKNKIRWFTEYSIRIRHSMWVPSLAEQINYTLLKNERTFSLRHYLLFLLGLHKRGAAVKIKE